jgi:hypothetical protein
MQKSDAAAESEVFAEVFVDVTARGGAAGEIQGDRWLEASFSSIEALWHERFKDPAGRPIWPH